jgi:hypothetical protein
LKRQTTCRCGTIGAAIDDAYQLTNLAVGNPAIAKASASPLASSESCLDSKLALLGKDLDACGALASFEQTTFGFIAQLRCGRWIVCARS